MDIGDRLWASLLTGEWLDLSAETDSTADGADLSPQPGGTRSVDGRLLRSFLTKPLRAGQKRTALRLRGAVITGELNWSWLELDCPIELEDCTFAVEWILENASIRSLALRRCRLLSIHASQLTVDGQITISESDGSGTIWLPDASVTGSIRLGKIRLRGADDWFGRQSAIVAPRLQVGGIFRLEGRSQLKGLVSFRGAKFGGGFSASDCSFHVARGDALDLQGAQVAGDVRLMDGFRARGTVRLDRAAIAGSVTCRGGLFRTPHDEALSLHGARVSSNLHLNFGFKAVGRVRCVGIHVGGNIECTEGRFLNPHGEDALWANSATVEGNVFLRNGCRIRGRVRMIGIRVGRTLDASRSEIVNPGGWAIMATNSEIGGDLQGRRARISGLVDLEGTTIKGSVALDGVRLIRPRKGVAFNFQNLVVSGSLFAGEAPATPTIAEAPARPLIIGRIEANNTSIGGQLAFRHITLNGAVPQACRRTTSRVVLGMA